MKGVDIGDVKKICNLRVFLVSVFENCKFRKHHFDVLLVFFVFLISEHKKWELNKSLMSFVYFSKLKTNLKTMNQT